jgi:repressor LexA
MTPALTSTERRVLNAIMGHILALGFPPSIREICKIRGRTSSNSSAEMLEKLERKGYILTSRKSKARAITVLRDADGTPVVLGFRTYQDPMTAPP